LTGKRIRPKREHGSFSALGQAALSALLATEAAQRREVKMFRREAGLGDELVPDARLRQWIDAQHAREAEQLSDAPWASENGDAVSFDYPGPEGRDSSRPDIRAGGMLEQLYRVSSMLARIYGWQRAQAVAFVVCGSIPLVRAASVSFRENLTYPRLSRIVLDVDPSLGPRQVLNIYRDARRRFISTRPRSIAARSAELIQFYCDHWGEGLSWREQMNIWNRQQRHRPTYRFKVETNFAKQVKNSIRSLLMADYRLWS
jgi:hypothetical protein